MGFCLRKDLRVAQKGLILIYGMEPPASFHSDIYRPLRTLRSGRHLSAKE